MTRLPLALEPYPDEGWHSYLTRRAAQHGCTVTALSESIGLCRDGRWPPYHGVALDRGTTMRLAPALGLGIDTIGRMQLSRYDQLAFDLDGLLDAPGIDTTRRVVHRQWTWLSGSTYCPVCLDQDGAWRLTWRLPWVTACLRHRVALRGSCPTCGGVPGLATRLNASAPSRVNAAPDGRLCTHPETDRGTCGADLTRAPADTASDDRLARTSLLLEVISSDSGRVAGRPHTSLQTLSAWRTAIALATRLNVVDSKGWGRTHRQNNPPRDPDLMDDLMAAAAPLVTAPTVEAGADVLAQWCASAGIAAPHRGTFDRSCQPSAAIIPVIDAVLARIGRSHTRLQRRLTDAEGRRICRGYNTDDIPQLAWPCSLPEHLRGNSRPDSRILRAVVAMALVRAVHGGDWIQAGGELGYPPDKARNWTRYAFSSAFPGLRDALIDTALTLGVLLERDHQQGSLPGVWSDRPSLDASRYGVTILQPAQTPGCRRDDTDQLWCPCTAATQATRAQRGNSASADGDVP